MHCAPITPAKNNRFNSGLYFFIAPTKGGKTLFSYAMAHDCDFDFLYVNEPRANFEKHFSNFYNNDGLLDRDSILTGLKSISSKGLVIDSVSDLFQAGKKEQGLGKGMTFEQQIAFKKIQRIALINSVTLIATVNSRLVPAIEAFEGTSEGYITVTSPGILNVVDRDSRLDTIYNLPIESLDEACKALGYGKWKSPSGSNDFLNVSSPRKLSL